MDLPRKFGPMAADHPAIGDTCPGCKKPIEVGDYLALVAIGPGDDEGERERARQGRPYNAIAIPAHYDCVTGGDS